MAVGIASVGLRLARRNVLRPVEEIAGVKLAFDLAQTRIHLVRIGRAPPVENGRVAAQYSLAQARWRGSSCALSHAAWMFST